MEPRSVEYLDVLALGEILDHHVGVLGSLEIVWLQSKGGMKRELLTTSCLSPAPIPERVTYRCTVTSQEIADIGGPEATWEDWKALFLSKEIPPARLTEGADFRMTEHKTGYVEIEFP